MLFYYRERCLHSINTNRLCQQTWSAERPIPCCSSVELWSFLLALLSSTTSGTTPAGSDFCLLSSGSGFLPFNMFKSSVDPPSSLMATVETKFTLNIFSLKILLLAEQSLKKVIIFYTETLIPNHNKKLKIISQHYYLYCNKTLSIILIIYAMILSSLYKHTCIK